MKKVVLLLLCMLFLPICSGCNTKLKSTSTENTENFVSRESNENSQDEKVSSGIFDIETARKNIVIKGQPFEIPKKLLELEESWTYEFKDAYLGEGEGLAILYYQGEEMLVAGLENYYEGKENDGIIYNLTIKAADNSSIDGIVPFQTTQNEIIEKYGSPDFEYEAKQIYDHLFKYGISKEITQSEQTKSKCVSIAFDEDDIVISVSITYSDLS